MIREVSVQHAEVYRKLHKVHRGNTLFYQPTSKIQQCTDSTSFKYKADINQILAVPVVQN